MKIKMKNFDKKFRLKEREKVKKKGKNIVCKFGGTSLSSSENILKVAEIIRQNNNRFVVVSAPGKRDKNDEKITDLLIECFNNSMQKKEGLSSFKKIKKRFEEIRKDLEIKIELGEDFDLLKKELLQHKNYDWVISRGEFIFAKLFAKFIKYEFLDAKDFIVLNHKKQVDIKQSQKRFQKFLASEKNFVIPGFYGANKKGEVVTFSRGGSDISGAIVAHLANAELYENYTDVDGFFSASPEIVQKAKIRKTLTYDELRLLSFFGAKVLHPDCVQFLKKHNIILNLKNTFNPNCEGTKICAEKKLTSEIAGLSGRKKLVILTAEKFDLSKDFNFLKKVTEEIENKNYSLFLYDILPDKIRFVIENNSQKSMEEMLKEWTAKFPFVSFSLTEKVCVVAIVSRALKNFSDVRKKVFNEVLSLNTKINFFVSQTEDCFVWLCADERHFEDLLNYLHKKLVH